MNEFEKNYCKTIRYCLKEGEKINSRNGEILQISGVQIKANLLNGFPIVTGKKIFPKTCFIETEWILKGITNINWLNDKGVKIWDQWADKNGELGPIYGHQLLNFNGINQIKELLIEFKTNKFSRRLLVSMWNPLDLKKMALPPCHFAFQFIIYEKYIDIIVYMRSLDLFIGLPYDMALYSSILSSFANEFNLIERNVIINAGSAHIYQEHIKLCKLYLKNKKYELPKLINKSTFTNYNYNEMILNNYISNKHLKTIIKK